MWGSICKLLIGLLVTALVVFDAGAVGWSHDGAPLGLGAGGKRFTTRVKRANNTYGSHYFASFSAIPLHKGTGYYKNTMVSLNAVAYGLTEHLSVSGAIDLVSLIRARDGGPLYTGRIQLCGSTSDLFHLGASLTYLNARVPVGVRVPDGASVPNGFFTAMGLFTVGTKDYQLTAAGGLTHDGHGTGRRPVFNLNGAARVFANIMLVTEHWIFSDPDRSFSAHAAGVRILGDELAIDIGLAYDKEYTTKVTSLGMPFVAATLNF